MGMTITEKILAHASGRDSVSPGENVWVNADVLMTHDVCGPGTIGIFNKEFGEQARVFDREAIVLTPDHYIFTADEKCHRNIDLCRAFAAQQIFQGYILQGASNRDIDALPCIADIANRLQVAMTVVGAAFRDGHRPFKCVNNIRGADRGRIA